MIGIQKQKFISQSYEYIPVAYVIMHCVIDLNCKDRRSVRPYRVFLN